MSEIVIETAIAAPVERCFDLARDVDTHLASTAPSGERAVGGVTSGLLGLSDEISWEARHFGIRFRLTARITEFEKPASFVDEQVQGPFKSWWHRHSFVVHGDETRMADHVRYRVPLGVVGRLVDRLVLRRYLTRLLRRRAQFLKESAEADVLG